MQIIRDVFWPCWKIAFICKVPTSALHIILDYSDKMSTSNDAIKWKLAPCEGDSVKLGTGIIFDFNHFLNENEIKVLHILDWWS